MKDYNKFLESKTQPIDIEGDIKYQEFEEVISNVIKTVLPKFYYKIWSRSVLGTSYCIMIAPEPAKIDAVSNAQAISFSYSDGVIQTQIYGGNGGGRLDLMPDEGSYLHSQGLQLGFRKYNCKKDIARLEKQFTKYMKIYLRALQDNRDRLLYQDKIDYSKYF